MPETPAAPRFPFISTVAHETHRALADISAGKARALEELVEHREARFESTGLDARTFSLVQLAVFIALDAPPASYAGEIANAIEAGVSAEDMLGLLRAVALQVGEPKVVAAAPEIMVALGLTLPGGDE